VKKQNNNDNLPFIEISGSSFKIKRNNLSWANDYNLEVYAKHGLVESPKKTFYLKLYDCTPQVTWTQSAALSKLGPAVTYSWSISFLTPATNTLCGDYSVSVVNAKGLTITPVTGSNSLSISAGSLDLSSPLSPVIRFTRGSDYWDLENLQVNIGACIVTGLQFTWPASNDLTLHYPEDSWVQSDNLIVTQNPACGYNVSFSLDLPASMTSMNA